MGISFGLALLVGLAAQADSLRLQARRLIEVESGRAMEPGRIAVGDGRIHERAPEDASTLELGDLTLLPGLVDAHVHLTLGGEPEANARAGSRTQVVLPKVRQVLNDPTEKQRFARLGPNGPGEMKIEGS